MVRSTWCQRLPDFACSALASSLGQRAENPYLPYSLRCFFAAAQTCKSAFTSLTGASLVWLFLLFLDAKQGILCSISKSSNQTHLRPLPSSVRNFAEKMSRFPARRCIKEYKTI